MTDKSKMSLVPPNLKNEDKLKAFIEAPEKKLLKDNTKATPVTAQENTAADKQNGTEKETKYPWDAPGVTPEIIKPFVLRLKQPDKLKAVYIVENSLAYRSLQDYFLKAILKQIDQDLEAL